MGFATQEANFGESDILMGLGWPAMQAYHLEDVFSHMIRLNALPHNCFSFYFALNEHKPSELLFGGIDSKHFSGELQYYDVVDKQFWTILMTDIKIGDKSLGICSKEAPCYVALDSGTSMITFPPEQYKQTTKDFPHIEHCNRDDVFPEITFFLGANGDPYTLPSDHYMRKTEGKDGSIDCSSVVSPLDLKSYSGKHVFLLGDIFMQIFYTVFDRDKAQVGLAKAVHESGAPETKAILSSKS